MTTNGRGTMRPQSRSPPFLVIGLVVALVILGANYWSLSSNNASLSNEVTELTDQLRMMSAKRVNAETRYESLSNRLKATEAKMKTDGDTLSSKLNEVESLKKDMSDKNQELQNIGKEKETCDSNLNTCETNINGVKQELQQIKEDFEAMKAEKDKPNTQMCDSVCLEKKRELLSQIKKVAGVTVLQALSQNGVDILEFKDSLTENKPANLVDDRQKKPDEKPSEGDKKEETVNKEAQNPPVVQNPPAVNQVPPPQNDNKPGNQPADTSTATATSNTSAGMDAKLGGGIPIRFPIGGGVRYSVGTNGSQPLDSNNVVSGSLGKLKGLVNLNKPQGLEPKLGESSTGESNLLKDPSKVMKNNTLPDVRNQIPAVPDEETLRADTVKDTKAGNDDDVEYMEDNAAEKNLINKNDVAKNDNKDEDLYEDDADRKLKFEAVDERRGKEILGEQDGIEKLREKMESRLGG